ncbi:MAG: hypothetical protein ACJ76Q_07800 [Solirubrobacteraceae bacterium]
MGIYRLRPHASGLISFVAAVHALDLRHRATYPSTPSALITTPRVRRPDGGATIQPTAMSACAASSAANAGRLRARKIRRDANIADTPAA